MEVIFIFVYLLFQVFKCEEPWKIEGNIKRMPQPTYLNVGMFFTREALENVKDKPDYYSRVIMKCAQIFSWHNIIYRVIYEEKWKEDKFEIYKTTPTINASKMLLDISEYSYALKIIDMHVATLITDHDSTSPIVGLAYIDQYMLVCGAYIVGAKLYNYNEIYSALTITHETGHCLGMDHYSGGHCIGFQGYCVMGASIQHWGESYPPAFSAESIQVLADTNTYLLSNPGKGYNNLYPACGNGILEDNEECDCGFKESCILKGVIGCCNYTTCKLIGESQCSDGPCCKNCQFTKNVVCRPKKDNMCDYEETCTGTSEHCPADDYKTDGTRCGDDMFCARGKCPNPSEKCSAVTTRNIISSDKCRHVLANNLFEQQCAYLSIDYCKEKEKLCSFVVCDGFEGSSPIYIANQWCGYFDWFMASLVNRDTDGLPCNDSHVCLGGKCTNATKNIKLCSSVRCAPSMACRNGYCYRNGATGTVCENVACAYNEVCIYTGKCKKIRTYEVSSTFDKEFLLYGYILSVIFVLLTVAIGIFVKEFFFPKKTN